MTYTSSLVTLWLLASCLTTYVLSSPTDPERPSVPLSQMEPEHACLFICNICFPEEEDSERLMDCSNRVCGSMLPGMCPLEKFIWLGRHCRHYEAVESMWGSR